MSDLSSLLEPGMLVRHKIHAEWGLGQVQSNVDGRVTVTFQETGKMVFRGPNIELIQVFDSSGQG